MLLHVVTYRWRDGVGDDQVERLLAALRELPGRIPQIRSYRFGSDLGLAELNGDFAIVAEFDDEPAWRAYLEHPDHLEAVELVKVMVDARTAVQLRLNQPQVSR